MAYSNLSNSTERFGALAHTVGQISTSYFTDLPERAKEVSLHLNRRLI
jgi:3-polyprenyl-4-hydroxybenzoate decarboxylase